VYPTPGEPAALTLEVPNVRTHLRREDVGSDHVVLPLRDENPTSRRAVITVALILINVAIYFGIQLPKSSNTAEEVRFTYEYAAVPCEIRTGHPVVAVPADLPIAPKACAVPATGIALPQPIAPHKNVWLAILFSMFLHGSVLHVLGNMLFLWIFGNNVEDQLGRFFYLVFYLVGGFVAAFVHIASNADSVVPIVGASGAIAAVLGAYFVWFPTARVLTVILPFFFFVFRLPAVVVLGLWFVTQFLTQTSSGIATAAHIGGFVFGALVALLLRSAGFPRQRIPVPGREGLLY
jgi:membrane associated rhomboid family serine protease